MTQGRKTLSRSCRERASDWTNARIIYLLRERGTSVRQLSIASGLRPATLGDALYRSWPKGEKIIAAAIGVAPTVIWPSRYARRAERARRKAAGR
jgi:Ner family transcriptional regulator